MQNYAKLSVICIPLSRVYGVHQRVTVCEMVDKFRASDINQYLSKHTVAAKQLDSKLTVG